MLCAHRRLLYSWVTGIDPASHDFDMYHFSTLQSRRPGAPAGGGFAYDIKGEEVRSPQICFLSSSASACLFLRVGTCAHRRGGRARLLISRG